MRIMHNESLSYNDVLLVPQYSEIKSRHEVDISTLIDKKRKIEIPFVASPMDTVSEDKMAIKMDQFGSFAVVHRYNTIEKQVELVEKIRQNVLLVSNVAAAIGVTGDWKERAYALLGAGANILCIDVAHGDHLFVKNALEYLRGAHEHVHLMAGNVATGDAFRRLSEWGADSVRVGVGGGSICKTRMIAGSGVPTFQSILDCHHAKIDHDLDAKIIADGGIVGSGEMVKALAAGADFIMVGSALAGCEECPGKTYTTSNGLFRKYRGMGSREAQEEWRGDEEGIISEGVTTMVPYKGPAEERIKKLTNGIKSGLSYSGAKNIEELQRNAVFIRQTHAGQIESRPHILMK
jgi:IMP dehydrogenase